MSVDLDTDVIDFTGFGRVNVVDLATIVEGEETFWSAVSESVTLRELNEGARRLQDIFTQNNHKFTLVFWKGVLKWQESRPGLETKYFITMLRKTIQIYLTWDLNDQNIFKILRYLASGFHKLVKLEDDQGAIVTLLYQLHKTDGEGSIASFINLFKTSVEKLMKPLDSKIEDSESPVDYSSKYYVVHLLRLLDSVNCTNMRDVFETLSHAEFCSAVSSGIVVYLEGRSDKAMSLIHRVICKLSSLCTQITSEEELKCMESVLVTNLLSYNYLLIIVSSNVLVFLARLAPSHYVTQLIHCLCDLVKISLCQIRSDSLRHLVSRLLPLVEQSELPQLQLKFIRSNSGLLNFIGNDQKKQELCNSALLGWKSSKIKTDKILSVLPICSTTQPLLTEISDLLLDISKCRKNKTKLDNIYLILAGCLERTRENWREHRNNNTVLQIFQLLDRLLTIKDAFISSLILDIIHQFSSYSSHNPTEYCSTLSQMFTKLVKCAQYPYLEKKCLLVIASFAKMTPHPELLGTLAQDPDLKSKLTDFLQHKVTNSESSSSCSQIPGLNDSSDVGSVHDVVRVTPGERLILNASLNEIRSYPTLPVYARRILSSAAS